MLAQLDRTIQRLLTWDWRREIIYLASAAMEIAWFTPWYLALVPATGQLPPDRTALGLYLTMILPTYAARLLAKLRLRPALYNGVLAVFLLLTCLLSLRVLLYAGQPYQGFEWLGQTLHDVLDVYQVIPDWFIIVLSTLFLWWRGIGLGRRRPAVKTVLFHFYVGIALFIAFVLIVNLLTRQDPSAFIPAFFFYSLVALAATRMDEMRGRRGAVRSPFGLSWLLAIGLAALLAVLGGVLLGAFLTGRDFRTVLRLVQPLLLIIGILLGLVVLALRTITGWVLGFFRGLGLTADVEPLTGLFEGLGELLPQGSGATIQAPPGLGFVRQLSLVGLLVALGVCVIFLLRRQEWRAHADHEGEQASFFNSTLMLESMREWVRAGRGRLAAALGLVRRSDWRGLFAALTIRRIYAQMLRLAALHGYPRAPAQTPYEFQQTAARAFPDAIAELDTITQAYVAVHYGEVPETEAELEQIRACWAGLKNSLRDPRPDRS